jgi:HEAT repeat protein
VGFLAARPPRVEKLKQRGDVPALLLAAQFQDGSPDGGAQTRAAAVAALAQVEGAGVSESLVRALADSNESVRTAAAEALRERGPEHAIEPLLAAVANWTAPESSGPRLEALALLEQTEDADVAPRAASALVERHTSLGDHDFEVVRRLVRTSPAAAARTLEQLVAALGDGGRGARAGAILVRLAPDSVDPLVKALEDGAKLEHAAFALGYIHDSRAVEPLCRLMVESGEPAVRRVAAWALGEIRDVASVEALLLATGDPDYDVRVEASRAFDQFGNAGIAVALTALMPPEIEQAFSPEVRGLSEGEAAQPDEQVEHAEPDEPEKPAEEPAPAARPVAPREPAVSALRRLLMRRVGL